MEDFISPPKAWFWANALLQGDGKERQDGTPATAFEPPYSTK